MLGRSRIIVLVAVLALAAMATVASAAKTTERVLTLEPNPAGNPEGVAFDKRTRAFFVSITADGAIYRGTLGSDTVSPFIPGETGRSAVGIKVRRGKLYVEGGQRGSITVYSLATKQVVAQFETGTGGFLNDLVVTDRGDVFVTDSFRPVLRTVTLSAPTAARHRSACRIAWGLTSTT